MSDESTHLHHHSALANRLDPRVHESDDTTGQEASAVGGDKQDASKLGEDPNIVKSDSKKLTGTGAPGSHSALFGLTPDGQKTTEADYSSSGTGSVKPAHSSESSNTANGGKSTNTTTGGSGGGAGSSGSDVTQQAPGSGPVDGGVGDRAPGGPELQRQMNDPRVSENLQSGTTESGKPGTGGASAADPEDTPGSTGGSFINTIKSYVTGGGSTPDTVTDSKN